MRGAWILALAVSLSAAMAAAQEAPEEEIGNPLGLTPAQRDALTQVFRRHTFAAFPDPAADAPLGVRLDPTVPVLSTAWARKATSRRGSASPSAPPVPWSPCNWNTSS